MGLILISYLPYVLLAFLHANETNAFPWTFIKDTTPDEGDIVSPVPLTVVLPSDGGNWQTLNLSDTFGNTTYGPVNGPHEVDVLIDSNNVFPNSKEIVPQQVTNAEDVEEGTTVEGIETTVEDLGTTVEDIGTTVEDLRTTVGNIGTTVGNIGTTVGDIETTVEDIGTTNEDVRMTDEDAEEVTTDENVKEGTTDEDVEQGTTDEDVEGGTANEDVEGGPIDEDVEEGMTDEDVEEEMADEDVEEEMADGNVKEGTSDKDVEEGTTDKDVEDESDEDVENESDEDVEDESDEEGTNYENIEDGTNNKDVEDGTSNKDIGDEMSNENIEDETINKNIEDGMSNKDIEDETSNTDIEDGTINKDVEEGTSDKDIEEGVSNNAVEESTSDKDVVKGTNDNDVEEGTSDNDIEKETSDKDVEDETSGKDVEEGTSNKDVEEETSDKDVEGGTNDKDVEYGTSDKGVEQGTIDKDDEERTSDKDVKEETSDSDVEGVTSDKNVEYETSDKDVKQGTIDKDMEEEMSDKNIEEGTSDTNVEEGTSDKDVEEETSNKDIEEGTNNKVQLFDKEAVEEMSNKVQLFINDTEEGTMEKDVEEGTSNKDVEGGTNDKDVEYETSDKDVEQGTIDKDIDEEMSDKVVEEGTSDKNVEEGTSDKDVEEGTSNKDVEEGTSHKDVEQGTSDKNVEEETNHKDVEEVTSNKDVKQGTIDKDIEEGTNIKDVEQGTSHKGVEQGTSNKDVEKGTSDEDKLIVVTPEPQTELPIQVACNIKQSDLEFFIQSPGFPDEYANQQQCNYVVARHSTRVCAIEITFYYFDLEMSPGCKDDYLAIGEERLCGQITNDSIVEYPFENGTNELHLVFKTNEAVTKGGYQISLKQLTQCNNDLNANAAVHACDVLITDVSGELVTHRGPESKEPACRYTIGRRHSGFCQVELDFIDFNVDYQPGCPTSFVQLDGHRFCGTTLRSQRKNVTFDALGNVQIIYRTDTLRSDRGFHLLYRQITCPPPGFPIRSPGGSEVINDRIPPNCNKIIYEKEFYLESPGFPNSYSNNLDCQIVIRKYKDTVCQVDFRFLDFDIEMSPGCQYDYLQLDSDRLCGRIPEDHVRTLNFWGYEKILRFKSDALNPRPGFFMYVRQLDCADGVPVAPTSPPPSPSVTQCNSHLWTSEGHISSPNYPSNYANNIHCQYTIHRIGDHICYLKISFLDFRLQPEGAGCYRDYLEIDGVRTCSDNAVGTIRSVDFQVPEKLITFTSDSWGTDAGFLLNLQQIPCGTRVEESICDREFQASRFELRSERYPQFYLPNLYCQFVVKRSSDNVCQLRIRFVVFELEPSNGCNKDYLSLDGEKFCGLIPGNTTRTLRFDTPEKTLSFRTDGAVEAPGFLASVEQVECSSGGHPRPPSVPRTPTSQPSTSSQHTSPITSSQESCNHEYNELRGTFNSPNFPAPYPGNVNCRYNVHLRPGFCQVELTFVEFYLEDPLPGAFRCVADYLELAGGKYCGQQLHGITKVETPYGSTREVSLSFFSNGRISNKGFLATYKQLPCSSRQPTLIPTVVPSQPSAGSEGDPSCSTFQTSSNFEIRGPELGNRDYGQTLQCVHKVRRLGPDTCGVRVTFINFDMGDGTDCPRQHLQIGDSVICGSLPAYTIREYTFQGYDMIMRLTSSRLPRPRMYLRVEQTPCDTFRTSAPVPTTCDDTFLGNVFEIRSPHYPHGHESRLACRYVVKKSSSSVCRLELTFERFTLPISQHCRLSHLRVDDDTICGSLVPFTVRVYDFASVEKLIHFQADHVVAGTGFFIRGRQIPCGAALETSPDFNNSGTLRPTDQANNASPSSIRCDQSFGLKEFTVFSPNHPDWYPPSVLCRYVVLRADPNVCGLDVTFLNFDLEDYYHCQRDYLDIDGERLCGLLPPHSTRHYAFHPADRTKIFVFRSDHATSRPGFALRIKQTTDCQSFRGSLLIPTPGSLPGQINRPENIPKEDNLCPERYISTQTQIKSPGYDNGMYYGSQHCLYTFIQRQGFCGVSIHFRDFDLYPSLDCMQDFLEIDGRKFCHQQLSQITREVYYPYSKSSTLSIIFHSEKDRYLNRGFQAEVEQLSCHSNRQARRRSNEDVSNSTSSIRSPTSFGDNWDDSQSDATSTSNSTSSPFG